MKTMFVISVYFADLTLQGTELQACPDHRQVRLVAILSLSHDYRPTIRKKDSDDV
jgi:hypothetical protein